VFLWQPGLRDPYASVETAQGLAEPLVIEGAR